MKTLFCLSLITLVASLSPTAHAQTFNVIHAFTGGGDGANPAAGVTYRAGDLYGTALYGGNGNGSVYQMMHAGNNWVTVPISIFSAGGIVPEARVVFGPDGHPYGTTAGGGAHSEGIVFDLIVPVSICKTAACFWKENNLYDFKGGSDGANPSARDLTWDHQGNIYGATFQGGPSGWGSVYELKPSGNGWQESVIYSFSGPPDGGGPGNGVILDANGNLFGTTMNGGLYNNCDNVTCGTVFELTYVWESVGKRPFFTIFKTATTAAFPMLA